MLFEHRCLACFVNYLLDFFVEGQNQFYFFSAEFSSHCCVCHLLDLNTKWIIVREEKLHTTTDSFCMCQIHGIMKVTHTMVLLRCPQVFKNHWLPGFHIVVRIEGGFTLTFLLKSFYTLEELSLCCISFPSNRVSTILQYPTISYNLIFVLQYTTISYNFVIFGWKSYNSPTIF